MALAVWLALGDCDGDAVCEAVALDVSVSEAVELAVPLAVADAEGVARWLVVGVAERVGAQDTLTPRSCRDRKGSEAAHDAPLLALKRDA